MTNSEIFEVTLAAQYSSLFASEPETYVLARKLHTPESLAKKMTSLLPLSASKDGEGIKRTCKIVGIKHTYTAIKEYLKG